VIYGKLNVHTARFFALRVPLVRMRQARRGKPKQAIRIPAGKKENR
jgi:hypothetical protein